MTKLGGVRVPGQTWGQAFATFQIEDRVGLVKPGRQIGRSPTCRRSGRRPGETPSNVAGRPGRASRAVRGGCSGPAVVVAWTELVIPIEEAKGSFIRTALGAKGRQPPKTGRGGALGISEAGTLYPHRSRETGLRGASRERRGVGSTTFRRENPDFPLFPGRGARRPAEKSPGGAYFCAGYLGTARMRQVLGRPGASPDRLP